MSIEHEPRNTLQAPLGAAWVWFKAWRSRYLQVNAMPLLPELACSKRGWSLLPTRKIQILVPFGTFWYPGG